MNFYKAIATKFKFVDLISNNYIFEDSNPDSYLTQIYQNSRNLFQKICCTFIFVEFSRIYIRFQVIQLL